MTAALVILVAAAVVAAVVANCADGWSRINHDIHDMTRRDADPHASWSALTREDQP
jgi:hypothetical protein